MLEIRPLKKKVALGFDGLALEDLVAVARHGAQVTLTENSVRRIRSSRQLVDRWVKENRAIYGITTGFGALSDVSISAKDTRRLQENILMSHSSGVGPPFDPEVVRATMALRIKDLARGHSGIRLKTVRQLAALLNRGVCPIVPQQGSVGASGDLAPLAHLALVLIGRGEALFRGQRLSGAAALRQCGLKPIRLQSGEGLALVNGTQVMTAVGGLALYDAIRLAKMIDVAAAMSLEVLLGSRTEFDARIHQVRPHPGQRAAADNMDRLIENSEIISSHKDCGRIQDAYTLRCSPQVHGGSRDAIAHARQVLETEMNSSTNNPLIFAGSQDFLLGGNFHGQPVAL
ncbi:MAG: histidine ammonia-lyase, partial [Deltaproteobacteria bacterium SG8_13]